MGCHSCWDLGPEDFPLAESVDYMIIYWFLVSSGDFSRGYPCSGVLGREPAWCLSLPVGTCTNQLVEVHS